MKFPSDNGMVHLASPHSVVETVERLKSLLQSHELTLFCIVDHSGAAEKAGLTMPPTQVVLFGSPKAGTPLMMAAPTIAIDLPLKALVWEDEGGKVWISYNTAEYVLRRHGIPDGMFNLGGFAVLLQKLTQAGESA